VMRKGDIYLADFGKSRDTFAFGKKRPVVIFQSDKLNFAAQNGIYEYFLVLPLSTKYDIVTDEFRLPLGAREDLKEDSLIVCSSICFLHKRYLQQKLASLTLKEIEAVEVIIKDVLDMR